MIANRRHHPASLLFKIGSIIRNSLFIFLILFVFQAGSNSTLVVYGRYAFIAYISWSIVSAMLNWLTTTYALDDQGFYLRRGIFSKTEQAIPFSKVQNINRHTSFFHRILRLTSISFETGIAGDDASVKFDVTTKKEASQLEAIVQQQKDFINTENPTILDETKDFSVAKPTVFIKKTTNERILHFQPTRRDLLKASMTSFSFLLLIPLLGSVFYNISEFINLDERLEYVGASILSSPWLIAIAVTVLVVASFTFGIIHSFIKYGKYEIFSDSQRIYIKKGIFSEASFSIAKERVQAIEITQTFTKRILGLAEVKLISAGSLSLDSEELNINSLYPFLPVDQAYALVSELLPGYRIQMDMQRLPRRSLWIRILKPSWIWLIATAILFYFKPKFLSIEETWWIGSSILLILIVLSRVLDFLHTRYCLNEELIQLKNGGFTSTLFVTKREKIVEVEMSQNRIQRACGLSSLQTVTRARPIHTSYLEDVPDQLVVTFHHWYRGRSNEVQLESTK